MLKLPKVIGHRGAAAYAPENTLEAIHAANEMDVRWVELDVKLTKDGIPVIFHDDTLERTTNGTGNVRDFTLAELKELDCGSWFSESFAGVAIPTLEETLDLLIELDMALNLEIKPCPGREVETAEIALDMLSRSWDDHDGLLVSSFALPCLETALDMAPDWHRGLLLDSGIPQNWQDMAEHIRPATINFNGNTADAAQIARLRSKGLPLLAYTINDADQASALFKQGVKSVFSDQPDLLSY